MQRSHLTKSKTGQEAVCNICMYINKNPDSTRYLLKVRVIMGQMSVVGDADLIIAVAHVLWPTSISLTG